MNNKSAVSYYGPVNIRPCSRCAKEVCELYWCYANRPMTGKRACETPKQVSDCRETPDVVLLNVYEKSQEIQWPLIQIK